MKGSVLFTAALLLLSPPVCRAEAAVKHLVSIDFSYTLGGILNHGWGIGINGEQKIMDYLSAKGTFGHMTFLTAIENVYCTSVNLSLFANYYPLGKGLDKLYIGMGGGCDFMNYFGGGELPDTTKDTLIHITPKLGWKFRVLSFLLIDVCTGYKLVIMDSANYREMQKYVNAGPQFGLVFHLLPGAIFKKSVKK